MKAILQGQVPTPEKIGSYSKGEVDRLLNGKANNATTLAGYNIGDAYTKSEVDVIADTKLNKYGKGINLLDNAYFVGGGSQQGGGQFPINQRGGYVIPPGCSVWYNGSVIGTTDKYYTVTGYNAVNPLITYNDNPLCTVDVSHQVPGYTGARYGIDRWRSVKSDVTITLTVDGLTINRPSGDVWTIQQKFEQLPSGPVTASALISNVLHSFTFANGFDNSSQTDGVAYFWANSADKTLLFGQVAPSLSGLQAVKLELGSEQTLAHQENGNWVLNDPPPNYQQELAKCQRYFLPVGQSRIMGTWDGNAFVIFVPAPATMRVNPSVDVKALGTLASLVSLYAVSSINNTGSVVSNGVNIVGATSDTAASNERIVCLADAQFDLSADL